MAVVTLNRGMRIKLRFKRFWRNLVGKPQTIQKPVNDCYYDPKQFRRKR